MGARQAVSVVHRRAIDRAEDPATARAAYAAQYAEEHLTATSAAAEGFVDEVVHPRETRPRLAAALAALDGVAAPAAVRNIPL